YRVAIGNRHRDGIGSNGNLAYRWRRRHGCGFALDDSEDISIGHRTVMVGRAARWTRRANGISGSVVSQDIPLHAVGDTRALDAPVQAAIQRHERLEDGVRHHPLSVFVIPGVTARHGPDHVVWSNNSLTNRWGRRWRVSAIAAENGGDESAVRFGIGD